MKEKRVQISMNMKEETYKMLNLYCKDIGMTRTKVIERFVWQDCYEHMKSKEKLIKQKKRGR